MLQVRPPGPHFCVIVPYLTRVGGRRVVRRLRYPNPNDTLVYTRADAIDVLKVFTARYKEAGQKPHPKLAPYAMEVVLGCRPPARFTLWDVQPWDLLVDMIREHHEDDEQAVPTAAWVKPILPPPEPAPAPRLLDTLPAPLRRPVRVAA